MARNSNQRTAVLRSARYPYPAAKASSDISERMPLHASTTSSDISGRISTLPSRMMGKRLSISRVEVANLEAIELQRKNDLVVDQNGYGNGEQQERQRERHGAQQSRRRKNRRSARKWCQASRCASGTVRRPSFPETAIRPSKNDDQHSPRRWMPHNLAQLFAPLPRSGKATARAREIHASSRHRCTTDEPEASEPVRTGQSVRRPAASRASRMA